MKLKYTAEHYKYQVSERFVALTSIYPANEVEDEFILLGQSGSLVIRSGYAWDGASGPTVDTTNSMRAGLVHDALYQLMREGKLGQSWRGAVDKEFYRLLREDGMSWLRASLWYRAVRRLAKPFAQPDHRRKTHTAP